MMMDNDFPVAIETSNPAGPRDVYKRPDESKEKYGPPPEGFQRPTPAKQAETAQFLNQYIARGIPVGEDPIFPMGQEEFSDYVRGRMEQRNPPNRPIPADIMRRIEGVRAKYGFGSV